jgi:UDP-2,3-diacylglucosamine pyrophosphatase LpxH
MTSLLTADIHLNDKPSDSYRWGLFDWLGEQKADELIIAGDLTDMKDRHPARLVNRFYRAIMALESQFRIIILRGNHDYYDVNHPFFEFLGDASDMRFIVEPTRLDLTIGSTFWVPAGVSWDFSIPKTKYLVTHATFSGAAAESGRTLTGVDPDVLKGYAGKVYSGDIHVPQTICGGKVEYIGAPYHTRFGDKFEPRVLFIDERQKTTTDLHYPAPKKYVLEITEPDQLQDEQAQSGDHVKIKCYLTRRERDKWRSYTDEIRRIAALREWHLFGVSMVLADKTLASAFDEPINTNDPTSDPEVLIAEYAKSRRVPVEYLAAGKRLFRND